MECIVYRTGEWERERFFCLCFLCMWWVGGERTWTSHLLESGAMALDAVTRSYCVYIGARTLGMNVKRFASGHFGSHR